jgi:hypothetical protein
MAKRKKRKGGKKYKGATTAKGFPIALLKKRYAKMQSIMRKNGLPT